MRFAILLSAVLVADAIKPGYQPQSRWVSAVIVAAVVVFFYADAIEFYKKVWKR